MNSHILLILCFSNVFFQNTLAKEDGQNLTMADRKPEAPLQINVARMAQMKMALRNAFLRTISICYDRFQRCSEQLSATFCASTTKNVTFYIWARTVADNIMNGQGDKNGDVKCYPAQIKAIVNVLNIKRLKNQPKSNLWFSIGKMLNNGL